MHYYQWHRKDYAAATAHLSPIEDIAYRRLLDLYFDEEGAIYNPDDGLGWLARKLRMRGEEEAIGDVLCEFFYNEDQEGEDPQWKGSWSNTRADKEIQRVKAKSEKARKSAASRWQSDGSADAMRTHSDRSANGMLPNTQDPIPKTQKKNTRARSVERPSVVSEEIWEDWLTVRRNKRAGPVTATAWKRLQTEAEKAGLELGAAVEECAARGWVSFKADWLKRKLPGGRVDTGSVRNMEPGQISGSVVEAARRAEERAAQRGGQ